LNRPQQFANSNYVFFGDSSAQTSSFSVVSNIQTSATGYPNDTLLGGDGTNSGGNVNVPFLTTSLLIDLPVTAVSTLSPVVGDSFTVSLMPLNDVTGTANPNTGFASSNDDSIFFPFTSSSGTVTIVGVPEPSSWILLATAVLAAGVYGSYRRRTSAAA
jgi:hypothetical protein